MATWESLIMAGNKKELKTRYSSKMGNMLEVYYEGGGQIPQVLAGLYTDLTTAQIAINTYVHNVKEVMGTSGGK